eukprot:COSAG06_NODE_3490_length_5271_cov_14.885731_3_plen_50_part_00
MLQCGREATRHEAINMLISFHNLPDEMTTNLFRDQSAEASFFAPFYIEN